jgi:hypothetical protein
MKKIEKCSFIEPMIPLCGQGQFFNTISEALPAWIKVLAGLMVSKLVLS